MVTGFNNEENISKKTRKTKTNDLKPLTIVRILLICQTVDKRFLNCLFNQKNDIFLLNNCFIKRTILLNERSYTELTI